jgi:MoxR-like ATPase
MSEADIKSILWHKIGVQDLRALMGRGGGHEVIAWGNPALWKKTLGITVKADVRGGTPVKFEEDMYVPGFEAGTYLHEGRNEVRLKVPDIPVGAQIRRQASAVLETKTEKEATEQFVVLIIRTRNDTLHLRAAAVEHLPAEVQAWVNSIRSGGRDISGVSLDRTEREIWDALLQTHSVLLYGPPGTGKTRLMLRIKRAFEEGVSNIRFDVDNSDHPLSGSTGETTLPTKRKTAFTTFHQSLTYESFVVGLRPVLSTEGEKNGSSLRFAVRDGLFLKLAYFATNPDSCALLLVDELNRGNVADILGELITLLEVDKRLDPSNGRADMTVTVTLPLKPEGGSQEFEMPYHFYTLASMNSLDRSVAPLDSALRRRFRLIELKPDLTVAERLLLGYGVPVDSIADLANPTPIEAKSLALAILKRVNDHIRADWGPEFLFGQSYVLGIADIKSLIRVCRETILPQVFELYRDRPAELGKLLGTKSVAGQDALAIFPAPSEARMLRNQWGSPPELAVLAEDDIPSTVKRLYWLAHGKNFSPPNQAQPAQILPQSP